MAGNLLLDLPTWQAMLSNHYQLFAAISHQAQIGLMRRQDFDRLDGQLLIWQVRPGKVLATTGSFTGFRSSAIDILFVLDEASLQQIHRVAKNGKAIEQLETELRQGGILFYAIKSKQELLELGYEDFLEMVGLPFLGGCQ